MDHFGSTVLCEEAQVHLGKLRIIVEALRSATFSKTASFDVAHGTVQLSEDPKENADTLDTVGQSVSCAVEGLVNAVETQITDFFAFMKRKEQNSILALLKHSNVPGDVETTNPDAAGEHEHCASTAVQSPVSPKGTKEVLPKPPTLRRAELRAGASKLKMCMFLMMESLLTRVSGRQAALYLRAACQGTGTIRRILHINGERFPREVCGTNAASLLSVMKGGLAVNVGNTTADELLETEVEANNRSFRPFAGGQYRTVSIKHGLIFPLLDFGCVIVSGKKHSPDRGFSVYDELQTWAFVSVLEGIMSRYEHSIFLEDGGIPSTKELEFCSQLPPISALKCASGNNDTCKGAHVTLETLPSIPQPIKILRATQLGKNTAMSQIKWHEYLTYEGALSDLEEYIAHLELLQEEMLAKLRHTQQALAERERQLAIKRR